MNIRAILFAAIPAILVVAVANSGLIPQGEVNATESSPDYVSRNKLNRETSPDYMFSREEQRRFEYEREQKQKDLQTLHESTCKNAPWLDRCQ